MQLLRVRSNFMQSSQKKTQYVAGFILLALVLIIGGINLKTTMLYFRLLIGLGFGYTLSRAYMGFAGSINRAYNAGSTKLMRSLMLMFFVTCIGTAGLLLNAEHFEFYKLSINPISLGLIIGSIMFGYGMSFSTCCATGVLTDLVYENGKALITFIFFSIGIFVGFPLQKLSIVTKSWFTSSSEVNGFFLPDLFKNGPLNGYLGALIITGILALLVTMISLNYEKKRIKAGTKGNVPSEVNQEEAEDLNIEDFDPISEKTYDKLFVKPWTLLTGSIIIAVLFITLMAVTGGGWGASTPTGLLFGRILMKFGVSKEAIVNYTKFNEAAFVVPFFEFPMNLQNIGIILGTLIYALTSGTFVDAIKSAYNFKWQEALLYVMGGLTMGIGTRFSLGCNVGAMYTPIAHFSLSGWVWFCGMVIGGIIGNKLQKKIFAKIGKE